jgi:hypothetical protein
VLFGGTFAIIFCLAGPVVAGIPSDPRLRMWALVLQVIGGAMALYDLSGAARRYGHKGIWANFRDWVKEGLFGRANIIGVSAASMSMATGRARVKVRDETRLGMPIWERIRTVESKLKQVDEGLDAALRELDQLEADLKDRIKQEASKRASEIKGLRDELREEALGSFAPLAFGAAWVLVGTILSAISPEIVCLAAGQWQTVLQRL